MTSLSEERQIDLENVPLDVETIKATANEAWRMELTTSTRAEINETSALLLGHLNLLVGQVRLLDLSKHQAIRLLMRPVERHLGAVDVGRQSHTTSAFNYMRDSAIFVSALLDAYQLAAEGQ